MPEQHSIAKARQVFASQGGTLRASHAIRLGIHPRTLYALRDRGEIEPIARGAYRLASMPALTNPDFVTVATGVPSAVICLISALAHHHLTTEVPHEVHIALPRHAQIPRLKSVPLRVFWYSDASLAAGAGREPIDGMDVKIFSPEKSIADCFKYRNKIGLDVAIRALRSYRERFRRPNLKDLTRYARINRVENVMRPYLEAIL